MTNFDIYKSFFGLNSVPEITKEFQRSLVSTNRSYTFYVDWKKVRTNFDSIKTEISLLDSLINSRTLQQDFFNLLLKYPEVVSVLPILMALRESRFDVIESFDDKTTDFVSYNFSKKRQTALTQNEIESYWNLIKKSGVTELFTTVRSFKDYVLGVEVGMDTNARANRSGTAMEDILFPLMVKRQKEFGLTLLKQKTFGTAAKETGIAFPEQLRKKKFDFLFVKNGKALIVETNYFFFGGSKQSIITSYIDYQNKLKTVNAAFMLITDGQAWNNAASSELDSGFDSLNYILNLSFVRRGFFDEVLKSYFGN